MIKQKISTDPSEPPLSFQEMGLKKATTFTGLCGQHDQELFKDIDTSEIDLTNSKHLFLLAYRSVLQVAHTKLETCHKIKTNGEGVNLQGLTQLLDENLIKCWHFYCWYKFFFDEMVLNYSFDQLDHLILKIDTGEPSIAVSSILPLDEYDLGNNRAKLVVFNVFPQANMTYAVFSYFQDDFAEFIIHYGKFQPITGEPLKIKLSELILRECENFVIAPRLFESLSQSQKNSVLNYIFSSTISQVMDKSPDSWGDPVSLFK